MKKKLFLILFIFLTFANLTFAADKVKIMNMDISDLMVRGFEIFDVSVDDSKVSSCNAFNSVVILFILITIDNH